MLISVYWLVLVIVVYGCHVPSLSRLSFKVFVYVDTFYILTTDIVKNFDNVCCRVCVMDGCDD